MTQREPHAEAEKAAHSQKGGSAANMEAIISLAKRRGFIYQGSEIYGGLAGTWDYGPLGVALKNNIKDLWWKRFVEDREDMYGMDAAILMNQNVWKASGHVAGFADPLVECPKCKKRFRADHLAEEYFKNNPTITHTVPLDLKEVYGGMDVLCPSCGTNLRNTLPRQFNMMFKTNVGATEDAASVSYLRPETAQGMFVNYKNVHDSMHPKLPFGLAQIGKAFRNEIAPRDFIFRTREFEQMEIEYFVRPEQWEKAFEHFREQMHAWTSDVGLDCAHVHELEVADANRAHYSKRTIDIEFEYPFGRKELYGLAYRTDFDLKQHAEFSGADLTYFDEETKTRFLPHCIEPSFGVDRTVLAVLTDAYTEDTNAGQGEEKGEARVFLKFAPRVAPIKVAVFPLLKNKPELVAKAREVYQTFKRELSAVGVHGVEFDDNGNIGKRYRRQDEIGTPYCVTVDFDTIGKGDPADADAPKNIGKVTLRDRDTGKQERVEISAVASFLKQKMVK